MNDQLLHNIALTMVPDVGPVNAKLLISYCGSAEAVFEADKKKLLKIPGIGPKTIDKLVNADPFAQAQEQINFLEKTGGKAVTFHSSDYPQRLKHFTVAIIGTRKPTELGKLNCERLVEGLKDYGIQIISGLAFGIDSCAHKAAVDNDIETIGITAHGLDRLYPSQNTDLARKMVKKGGILCEYPIGTNPDRENFPMRNRIIASMSDAIIVVESKRKGGSIITAEFANSYNKDVFAIPGRISDLVSEGCNKLIKQHKANLLESAADISYIMRWDEIDKQRTVQKALFIDYTPEEQRLVDLLGTKDAITVDELNYTLKMPQSELAAMLLTLEFKGALISYRLSTF